MLQDCNLVLYSAANSAIWNSNTYNPANAPCTLSVLSAVGGYIEVDTSAGAAVFRQPPNTGALKTGQQLPQVGAPSPHYAALRSWRCAMHPSWEDTKASHLVREAPARQPPWLCIATRLAMRCDQGFTPCRCLVLSNKVVTSCMSISCFRACGAIQATSQQVHLYPLQAAAGDSGPLGTHACHLCRGCRSTLPTIQSS